MLAQFAAVGVGAALGAWARWGLSAWLNPRIAHFPLGTLAANLVGGYLVGVAVAYFVVRHDLPPEWRLFAITGFLGGLTTSRRFRPKSPNCWREGTSVQAYFWRRCTFAVRCC